MKSSNLTNEELITTVKAKAQHERQLTVEVIELLQEVLDRDLHSKMGYGSLLKFCVEELKYSESAAYRRISALRLAKDVPEIKQDLATGTLTLQVAAQAQTFLNQERKYLRVNYTPEQKKALVQDIKNKSSREVERFLAAKSPELPRPETSRQIQEDKREVRLTINKDLDEKLDRIKSRYSHKNQNPTLPELLELMADEILQKSKPNNKTTQGRKSDQPLKPNPRSEIASNQSSGSNSSDSSRYPAIDKHQGDEQSSSSTTRQDAKPAAETRIWIRPSNPRYISRAKREYIATRDENRCCYKDKVSGRVCGSRHLLEIDHILPVALGGSNNVENLRLVCRLHNSMFAKELSLSRIQGAKQRGWLGFQQ